MTSHTIDARVQRLAAARSPDAPLVPSLMVLSCVQAHLLRRVRMPQSACIMVLKGHKTLISENDRLVARPGDMFLLPALFEVTIENVPDPSHGVYRALCLTLAPETVARVLASTRTPPEPKALALGSLRVRMDGVLEASLAHLLDMAEACPDNERLLALCLEAFLLLVSERTSGFAALWRAEDAWKTRCARVVGVDTARTWTAAGLAARLGVSERTFRRHLRREGTTFREVLRDTRLEAALVLLQSGSMAVSEASFRCGYESPSRFATRFRERYGVKPSDIVRFVAGNGQHLAGSELTKDVRNG
ncbi:helix-turn-helix domain-containing protein [Desulfolutivibrio sulfoxidireducens]|uniref:helix-turn-helix domain-containing protein n=1 Tax=Desulfolutivibrio sulfoxidireducens TaxID=2773299 RepID=UPI00159DA340|nr:helix-turn-helix domain-containing protein [Desulfolutivibrio sulfoxidireducens]QLA15131.1 helix-turn-helix domain-containing protein [Desulfolutivibrio sulfoxidireducens]QLA18702.1 helix-turn-helix domain-containing protein [Desulfolutivibrio sulfoxidireducens]